VRTHDALQAQQLRLLVDQIPAIVWTVDRNDRFRSVLGAGLEPLGARTGTVDIAMREALADSDALRASINAHRRALEGKRSRYAASWRERLFECCVEPLRSGRRIVGSIGVAVDVTNERRAESEALRAYEEGVDCLVRAIESRDIETGQHVARMSLYCSAIAEALGLDSRQCQAIGIASRLHDVGKIGIPDKILLKSVALTREERAIIERHCRAGWEILVGAGSEILQLAAVVALTHHEWFDGTGYPQKLAGESIPLPGRIAAIADVFDALTSERPYRAVLPVTQARTVMLAERGTHFDPSLLDLFMGIELQVHPSSEQ
jgi:HD-GYP domain-containing protein (c-di-GMP phosphodiesterase class II)